jgi:GT2 family glycosyltransferase
MHDLAIVIVSYGSVSYLPACLDSISAHAGELDYEVVVSDNDPTEDVARLLADAYPWVRHARCENHGFAHANNRGLEVADARHVLFLNPDTELLEGTLADLVRRMDAEPEIGVLGVVQELPDGELAMTMRRFPSPARELANALGIEAAPMPFRDLGERVLDRAAYARDTDCDWMSGSFLLVRDEALRSAGVFDERFFLFAEETDLCLRIKQAGWSNRHTPAMRILHHAGKAGHDARIEGQMAFARRQYAAKHFTPARRLAYVLAIAVRHGLRAALSRGRNPQRQVAEVAALRGLLQGTSPFEAPPATAYRAGASSDG